MAMGDATVRIWIEMNKFKKKNSLPLFQDLLKQIDKAGKEGENLQYISEE